MLETRRDPRTEWHRFCALPAPSADDIAAVLALPPGARQAPAEWVVDIHTTEHVSFDRDAMEEYVRTTARSARCVFCASAGACYVG